MGLSRETARAALRPIVASVCALVAIVCSVSPCPAQDCDGNGIEDALEIQGPLVFERSVDLAVGVEPTSLAVGDIDGDGREDLAIAVTKSNGITVLWNRSEKAPAFELSRIWCAGTDPRGIALGDLDGDGRIDVVVGSEGRRGAAGGSRRVRAFVLRGLGGGQFGPICDEPCLQARRASCQSSDFIVVNRLVDAVRTLELVDVDEDGQLDAVLGLRNGEEGLVGVLLGDGRGAFTALGDPVTATLRDSRYIAVLDADADGHRDIVTASGDLILGPFSLAASLPRPLRSLWTVEGAFGPHVSRAVARADLDGDGSDELIVVTSASFVAGSGGGRVRTFRRQGAVWTEFPQTELDNGPFCDLQEGLDAGDLDGDGDIDLVVLRAEFDEQACRPAAALVLWSDGSGGFSRGPRLDLPGALPRVVRLIDVSGDGSLAVAVAYEVPGEPMDRVAIFTSSREPSALDADGNGRLDVCQFWRGDSDADGRLTIADAIGLLGWLFSAGPVPACLEAGDWEDDGAVALDDAIALLVHLFRRGPPPAPPGAPAGDACQAAGRGWTARSPSLSCTSECAF